MHILLDPMARPVVGHRGNAAHAPENTLEAIGQGLAAGADAVEFDVHVSADGVPVIIHDPTVDRTTDGRGAVASMTVAQLQALDAGARFTRDGGRTYPYRGLGIRIPTLAEVLERYPLAQLLLEIKSPLASVAVRRVLEAHSAMGRAVVAAFASAGTHPFRSSGIALGAAQSQIARLIVPALLRLRPRSLPFDVMCIPRSHRGIPLPIAAIVEAARPTGRLVHIWTIDDPSIARRLWAVGVRGIISNDPASILRARDDLDG